MSARSVIVIGGGIIGVSSAYALASRGFRTTLLEGREDVALETSFANGSLLTPSMSDPWNAPGVHRHLMASLFDSTAAMRLRPSALPGLLCWGTRFLGTSNRARHREATRANLALARYSVRLTGQLRDSLGLEFDSAACGTLRVFRDEKAMDAPLALARQLATYGLRFESLKRDAVIEAEPALRDIRDRIACALRFPDDESGDARQFTVELTNAFQRAGGIVRTGVHVAEIRGDRNGVAGVVVEGQVIDAKVVVVAAGIGTNSLVRGLGVRVAVAPAKGYTITFDASGLEGLPLVPIVDDALHAAIVPLGTRLRIAGTVEFAGMDPSVRPERVRNLTKLLADVYPRVAAQLDLSKGQPWAGLRPMSADGLPFVGGTSVKGLFINAGHGHLGWTLASGSANLLADLVTGEPPQIDPAPYCIRR